MRDVAEREKGCTEKGDVAKATHKGKGLAAAFKVEDWGRNAWSGEPFPLFVCMVDLNL